tara:strand:+ start:1256 stop:1627 length:372 start_codon:yes stop_codon:yes gene_type:complete
MDDYNQLLKKTLDLRSKREEKFKDMSKNRLYEISRKKIQTTMIGALDSIEKSFGFLWQAAEGDMSAEQQELKKIFESTRSEILDRGNTQMRNLQAEFINYDITWKKYSLNLPVVKKEGEEKDG